MDGWMDELVDCIYSFGCCILILLVLACTCILESEKHMFSYLRWLATNMNETWNNQKRDRQGQQQHEIRPCKQWVSFRYWRM